MNKKNLFKKRSRHPADLLWDLWCVASVVGIWPRFIEPKMLSTTQIKLAIPNLPEALQGLKILQFSDLHWHENMSPSFLQKLIHKVESLSPDIIVFTGDALCYGLLADPEPLQDFLNAFQAPYGCYAVLGNHDYQEYVSVNRAGDYDIDEKEISPIKKGWKRLLTSRKLTAKTTPRVKQIPLQQDLLNCFKNSPFELLHNATKVIPVKNSRLNICGLGEHMLGRCLPQQAYKNYDTHYPGIVLLHNPDGLPSLKNYPGNIVLSGHTHGGQVNLPILSKKFMFQENPELKRGLLKFNDRWVYINRGTGSVMPFRWFSTPELLLLTLVAG